MLSSNLSVYTYHFFHIYIKLSPKGNEIVVSSLGSDINVGLSTCYDVRFPELYSSLVKKGANVMLIPSAFTLTTGMAHWDVLLRARAIETQSYVIAAAQTGQHAHNGRQTYGHACIIDPWGTIVS